MMKNKGVVLYGNLYMDYDWATVFINSNSGSAF
jgi:hypothetical protein